MAGPPWRHERAGEEGSNRVSRKRGLTGSPGPGWEAKTVARVVGGS